MIPADDELLLRAALSDLTSDQPPAPASRYAAVRRKASARRRHHTIRVASISVLAAMAVAVSAAIGLGAPGAPPPVGPAKRLPTKMNGLPMPAGTEFQFLVSAGQGAGWYSTA